MRPQEAREETKSFGREWEGEMGFVAFKTAREEMGARLLFGERLQIQILDLFYENGLLGTSSMCELGSWNEGNSEAKIGKLQFPGL